MPISPPADLMRLADARLSQGLRCEAIDLYREALAGDPAQPVAWFNLGWALRASRRFDEALAAYAEAIARGIDCPEEAMLNRAAILSDHLFRADAATAELEHALAVNPTYLPALLSLGVIREDMGDAEGACAVYERALAAAPTNGRAAARLGVVLTATGDPAAAVRLLSDRLSDAAQPEDESEMLYALGDAFDHLGRYDDAFAAFDSANLISRSLSPRRYDPRAQEELVDRLIATFAVRQRPADRSLGSSQPLFICGMFRSGSTLAERILSRHPSVAAAGELDFIPALAGSLSSYPEQIGTLTSAQLEIWRDGYLRCLPDAPLVIDKRCDNILHLGLARGIFPESRIVHTHRQPLDNLLSVYFLNFGDEIAYGHDLADATHYYIQYRRLLRHWQEKVFGDIVDLDYDRMVADPRGTLAPVMESLGLVWDAAVLSDDESAGPIRTASTWQVRKPLYARSSGRWIHYERQLAEPRRLLAAAGL